MKKACTECKDEFNGRADARFCSDQCRTSYHNRTQMVKIQNVRLVNSILKKNRKILEKLIPDGKTRVQKTDIIRQGFDFNYFTNIYRTKAGKIYYFCYEFGYIHTGDDWYTIVVKEAYV